MNRSSLLPLLALALPFPAAAAEVVWDGHYRAEGHFYDSLSLSDTNTNAEGVSAWFDHKARLRPGFLMSDAVGLYTELELLPSVMWGESPSAATDPTTLSSLPLVLNTRVEPPSTADGAATLENIRLSRLWGEVWFHKVGRLRFGRMPVEWGSGMVFNAGDDPSDDLGDTEDRVQFTGKAGPVYVMGAFGVPYEGFVGESDDMSSVTGSVAHLTEQAGVGGYGTYRFQSFEDEKVGVFIGDVWGRAELGPVTVEGEFASVVGSGDLDTGANDVSISAFGAQVSGLFTGERLLLGLGVGIAGGDKDPEDKKLHAFAFDPDFDLALLMFEQPMPVLAAPVANESNGGRNEDAIRTTNGLANAVYLRPSVGYRIRDDLTARLTFFAAQAAKLPEDERANKGYGSEIDAQVEYRPFDHFSVDGTFGTFIPGRYYRNYEDDSLGSGFDNTAFGVRLQAAVEF